MQRFTVFCIIVISLFLWVIGRCFFIIFVLSVRGSEKIGMELLMYFLATVKCAPKISMNCFFVVVLVH